MLSDRAIKNIKATEKHQFISDGLGLYLRVHPSGKKQFVLRSRVGGKSSWVALGDYPTLSLLDARTMALNKAPRKDIVTVDYVFDEYYKKYVLKEYKDPLPVKDKYDRDIKPTLGARPVDEVTRAEVSDVLQKIVERGSPVMANRVLAEVKHIFDYAVGRGWIEANVLTPLKRKHTGGREEARQKVLSIHELTTLNKLLHTPALALSTRIALALILLTGQRSSEVVGVSKAEIVGTWWIIPASRTKASREQKVYLSVQARALLKIAFDVYGDQPLLCDPRTLAKALKRKKVGYTPHDLRRTLATGMADMGVLPHVTEKILNHKMEGVMAVYNYAEYLPERKEAWQRWGHHIASIRRQKD